MLDDVKRSYRAIEGLPPEAVETFVIKFPNFARRLHNFIAGDLCLVIGWPQLHPTQPLWAVCLKHAKRMPHKINAVSGGIRKNKRHAETRPTSRHSWAMVADPYYLLWTYNGYTGELIAWPQYPINHPRQSQSAIKRLFADMG